MKIEAKSNWLHVADRYPERAPDIATGQTTAAAAGGRERKQWPAARFFVSRFSYCIAAGRDRAAVNFTTALGASWNSWASD